MNQAAAPSSETRKYARSYRRVDVVTESDTYHAGNINTGQLFILLTIIISGSVLYMCNNQLIYFYDKTFIIYQS